MEWKNRTLRSMLKGNKEKVLFLFCSGLLLFVISLPDSGKTDLGWKNRAAEVLADVGDESVADPSAGSDNFAEFLAAFPGFYMNLGTHSNRPGTSGNHHNPTFDVDESTFKKDMELFVLYTQRFLA